MDRKSIDRKISELDEILMSLTNLAKTTVAVDLIATKYCAIAKSLSPEFTKMVKTLDPKGLCGIKDS